MERALEMWGDLGKLDAYALPKQWAYQPLSVRCGFWELAWRLRGVAWKVGEGSLAEVGFLRFERFLLRRWQDLVYRYL